MGGIYTLLRLLWFGSGLLGLFMLTRDPDKLVFDNGVRGSTLKTMAVIFTSVCALGGPLTILIALLVPPKMICPNCQKATPKTGPLCRHCGALLPLPSSGASSAQSDDPHHDQPHPGGPAIQAAVQRGIRTVNMPIPFIMMAVWLVGMLLGEIVFHNLLILVAGFILGFGAGWLWWSYSVPRWRRWALAQPGVKATDLQAAAEEAMLVWPAGHFLEKTELKLRNKSS